MVEAGDTFDVLFALIDPANPFEIDEGNEPHLVADEGLSADDVYDAFFGCPLFYEDVSEGAAEWLMVGEIPGGQVVVVPLTHANGSGLARVRPITILPAPTALRERYYRDLQGE